ncbi:transcriptional regulator [Agromyces luteolus]|uniref:Helix-turn-helix domain-containing protein n=1 Tax=Agromyces luteolus TaxID=88373 RepID=A0A7C9LWG2_9MICO|nr:helix-turn-helix domain-containing protein [Agromyces luteolus]MUN06197.1 helix-turn-helix domain-containing protein [Agromyces luteolus]GLK29665.1 transcriptional regulator [Agromyces luteolus]
MTDAERPPAESSVHLHDPGPMRAMAHPMRLRIIGLLRMEGPATVGMLSAKTGESAGSVSYHMATLAKHGFVEEAPELARDRRERWWRAVHEMTSWNTVDVIDDPVRHAASDALRRTVLESYHRELLAALDAEAALEPEWIAPTDSSDGAAHLTLEEFQELSADLAAVRDKWWARRGEPAEGTRLVRWMTHVFPRNDV